MQILKDEMLERVKNGNVLKKIISKKDVYGDQPVIITKTSIGTYGYQLFRPNENEPYYVAEANYYFDDIEKKTASNGEALMYPGAKSVIARNLLGQFCEYINEDFGYENFYFCFKSPEDAEIKLIQKMAGPYPQNAIILMAADLYQKTMGIPTWIQDYIDEKGKRTFRIGISEDFDDNLVIDDQPILAKAKQIKKILGEDLSNQELIEVVKEAINGAYKYMGGFLEKLGILLPEGQERIDLLSFPGLYGSTSPDKNVPLTGIEAPPSGGSKLR